MTENMPALPAEIGPTEITRFNALKHGVLSRYTVLPWESADEYDAVLAALIAEHAPQGPTEEHLVEELAGIFWRKRRLRLAEAAAHRRGLDRTLVSQTFWAVVGYSLLTLVIAGASIYSARESREAVRHAANAANAAREQAEIAEQTLITSQRAYALCGE